jgi:hypothetical protein
MHRNSTSDQQKCAAKINVYTSGFYGNSQPCKKPVPFATTFFKNWGLAKYKSNEIC